MSSTSSRGQLVFRSSLLYVWVTRGPFGRRTKSLCDFGDMAPHTLVGGAQTTLTARASVRADRRNDPREAWGPRGDTQSRPPGALDRCAGVTGAVGTARNITQCPLYPIPKGYNGAEGVNPSSCLNPLHITPHSERVVRAHGGLGDRRWAWLVSTRCIGLGPCVKCRLGLRYQPARA